MPAWHWPSGRSTYGLHLGLDVAWGPDDPVVYVVFGSAWLRP